MDREADEVGLRLRAGGGSGAELDATASLNCGDGLPNTFVMSPEGPVPVFSSTVFAVATAPKSQPARVYGTHGAGAFLPSGVIMFGTVGAFATIGSVQ